jgi:hypothetical protein
MTTLSRREFLELPVAAAALSASSARAAAKNVW